MEEFIVTSIIKKILDGNIAVILISAIVGIAFIIYLALQFTSRTQSSNNELSDQVENSINLIVELIKGLEETLSDFMKEVHTEFKHYDAKFVQKLENIEFEVVRLIDDLEHNLQHTLLTNNTTLITSINNNTTDSIETLEKVLNRDLIDIRLQRKEIKETLESNIKEVKLRLDNLQEVIKTNEINNSTSIVKINNSIDSLKQSIDVSLFTSSKIKPKGSSN
jgi:ElaB/YqjD/DUF883 family membrane-anchored ribosome-binding protein